MMNTLLTLFGSFLSWIRNLIWDVIGLIMPLFSTERLERMAVALWFTLHILAVLGVAALLWWLDGHWKFHEQIRVQSAPLFVARAWMSILWLLIYAVFILCFILYRLLTTEPTVYHFPDIDQAWEAAREALAKSNLEFRRLPIILVLGRAEAGDDTPFLAGGLDLEVKQSPPGEQHPVHLYATRKAIFVTCPGASVLGGLSAWLHGDSTAPSVITEDEGAGATLRPGQGAGGGGGVTGDIAALLKSDLTNPVNRRQLRRLERKDNRQKAAARTPETIETDVQRFKYVCKLIGRERTPQCPINGILVLIPFAGLDSDQDAALVADACERDLKSAREATGQHCPVLAVVADMESAPGFAELVSRFPEGQRRSRVGQGMPWIPQFRGDSPERTLASLAQWVSGSVMRYWTLTKCQLEKAVNLMVPDGFTLNVRLFALLDEMTQRRQHLVTVLSKGFSTYAPPDRLLFGGCYLAGTGRDKAHQAFMADVFDKLIKSDEYVYWTDEVMNEENTLLSWVYFWWLVLVLFAVVAAAFSAYVIIYRR